MTWLARLRVDADILCGVSGLVVDGPLISYCHISSDLICILRILLLFSARLVKLVRILAVHGCSKAHMARARSTEHSEYQLNPEFRHARGPNP